MPLPGKLLLLPLAADRRVRGAACGRTLACARWWLATLSLAAPFYLLWAAANILYVQALAGLDAALVSALFSVTPALVALLSVPLLGRRLTFLAALACVVSAGGVACIAQPWQLRHNNSATSPPAPPVSAVLGEPTPLTAFASALSVIAAAACAALYKVLFRRWHGDAPSSTVLTVLACIGLWSATLGTPILLLLDPKAFAQAGGAGVAGGVDQPDEAVRRGGRSAASARRGERQAAH